MAAGIYIHIPFCRKACHYCNYHFSTNQKLRAAMVDAILTEWHLRKHKQKQTHYKTLYLGGGTPSILTGQELEKILSVMGPLDKYAEVTLEANPDDITDEKLSLWQSLGIRRLSVGIQSFHQHQLDWMGRIHTAAESRSSLDRIFKSGYENITIDLIYGMAEQSIEEWQSELKMAFEYPIKHLSAYQLTVEEKTALHYDIKKGKYKMPDDKLVVEQFDLLMDWMDSRNWEHYEISNMAVKGYRARHNSLYWSGAFYIGLGPGAHSYDGKYRSWNITNNFKYIQAIKKKSLPQESELITDEMHFNEWLLTRLRCIEGLDFKDLKQFPDYLQQHFHTSLRDYPALGYLEHSSENLRLTRKGKHFADRIASDFMYV